MKALHIIAFILLVIGGLNWLLVGLFNKDLFTMLGMHMTDVLPKIVYILVGLSAIWEAFTYNRKPVTAAQPVQPAM